jgi:hypothetical protein
MGDESVLVAILQVREARVLDGTTEQGCPPTEMVIAETGKLRGVGSLRARERTALV